MRLCPGGGGGGLFLDRVELPPGVSEEGGPDGGGALPWFLGGSGGPSATGEELRSVEALYIWLVKAL